MDKIRILIVFWVSFKQHYNIPYVKGGKQKTTNYNLEISYRLYPSILGKSITMESKTHISRWSSTLSSVLTLYHTDLSPSPVMANLWPCVLKGYMPQHFGWHATIQHLTTVLKTCLVIAWFSKAVEIEWEWGGFSCGLWKSHGNGVCVLLHNFWKMQRLWKSNLWSCFKNEGLVWPGAASDRL